MRFASILLLGIAGLFGGCATLGQPPGEKFLPPAALLEDCPVPILDIQTNADLVKGFLALRFALELCNNDKATLREWARTTK